MNPPVPSSAERDDRDSEDSESEPLTNEENSQMDYGVDDHEMDYFMDEDVGDLDVNRGTCEGTGDPDSYRDYHLELDGM